MSALGQKRTLGHVRAMSALPQTLELSRVTSALCEKQTPALQQIAGYSITSSASASKFGGTVRPSAFAVLRLMISSNFVGACTGRSAGFSPLRRNTRRPHSRTPNGPHLPNHIDMECGTIRGAGVAVWIRTFGELALRPQS